MKIAVLTFTRDRLAYTQDCFESLNENAGCWYDHYVLDQGSTDGTVEWLRDEYKPHTLVELKENIGICKAANWLLDLAPGYDVYVRFDNDCLVQTPDTLRAVTELARDVHWVLAPQVLGLNHPPLTTAIRHLLGYTVHQTAILGGIFMAIPKVVFDEGFRYDETMPPFIGDEMAAVWWHTQPHGNCGYLQGYEVEHYKGTNGQVAEMGWYFDRRVREGGPAA